MQRADHDAGALQVFGQVEREHHLGQLALGVGAASAEVLLDHDVVEVDGRLSPRGDVHDARRRAVQQARHQHVGQEKGGEIVDLEAILVAVLGEQPFVRRRPEAGVVDEKVHAAIVGEQRLREPAHVRERGQVGAVEAGTARPLRVDGVDHLRAPLLVAPVHDHVMTPGAQPERQFPSQPRRRSGHQRHLLIGSGDGGRLGEGVARKAGPDGNEQGSREQGANAPRDSLHRLSHSLSRAPMCRLPPDPRHDMLSLRGRVLGLAAS